jgi:hypothetical protein
VEVRGLGGDQLTAQPGNRKLFKLLKRDIVLGLLVVAGGLMGVSEQVSGTDHVDEYDASEGERTS